MRLMHLCRHSQAPLFLPRPHHHRHHHPTIPASLSLPPIHSPPFLPLERVSLSNSTDAHTWRDRMRHYLTQTDAHTWHRGFFACWDAHTHTHTVQPPTYDDAHTHIIVGIWPHHHPSLQITVAHIHSMYLQLYQRSVWCKTPYIGIPAQERWLKQPPVYSQPPFRRIREGRAGERGETKKEQREAKIRGTVKRDVGQNDALSPQD